VKPRISPPMEARVTGMQHRMRPVLQNFFAKD
jgi:hypothetical protein